MAWWEGVEEARVLIAPDPGSLGDNTGRILCLCHPKSGNKTCYVLTNGVLQELNWFKQAYGSWFLGDYVCEDGRLYTATQVDPVFILLPIFEEARMKKDDDPGRFRQLDEIMYVDGYPGYQQLLPIAENFMQVVCEIKEVGSSKFFRLDDSKVLAWLHYKVCQVKKTLPTLDRNYAAQNEKDTLLDAVSIVGEYVKDESWLKLLCNHLKLDLAEANTRVATAEVLPKPAENGVGSTSAVQEKSQNGKKATKTGRQAKKPKIETGSQNIKNMFTRASRRK